MALSKQVADAMLFPLNHAHQPTCFKLCKREFACLHCKKSIVKQSFQADCFSKGLWFHYCKDHALIVAPIYHINNLWIKTIVYWEIFEVQKF